VQVVGNCTFTTLWQYMVGTADLRHWMK